MAGPQNSNLTLSVPEPSVFESSVEDMITFYDVYSNYYKHELAGLRQKNSPALLMIIPNSVLSGAADDDQQFGFKTTNKFILTNLGEGRTERTQIMETFGNPSVFFFDERVKTYSLQGILIDNLEDSSTVSYENSLNWGDNFKRFYDENLRGTQLARRNEIALISVNDNLIYGYPLSLSINTNSQQPNIVSFSMSFLVAKHSLPNAVVPSGASEYQLWKALGLQELNKLLDEARDELETELSKKTEDGNGGIYLIIGRIKELENAIIPAIQAYFSKKLREIKLASRDQYAIEEILSAAGFIGTNALALYRGLSESDYTTIGKGGETKPFEADIN